VNTEKEKGKAAIRGDLQKRKDLSLK